MATRQKKREQEQKKKREQEQKEAEAEEYLDERRAIDGEERFWSQEIQKIEDAIKNSQDSEGNIQHQRWVVEAKEVLEEREKKKIAELEEEERRQMEEEEEERRILSER